MTVHEKVRALQFTKGKTFEYFSRKPKCAAFDSEQEDNWHVRDLVTDAVDDGT